MEEIRPVNLILRCYAHKTGKGNWFGLCIDLNIGAEADSPDELKTKMSEFIESYIETVADTTDHDSVPQLLKRRAPLRHWVLYYFIRCLHVVSHIPSRFTFDRFIPLRLAAHC